MIGPDRTTLVEVDMASMKGVDFRSFFDSLLKPFWLYFLVVALPRAHNC